ncbi:MAG: NAD-dependent epimerase/dehydratase family protein [Candidatus Acididesulfobacter guangdongensis]|uniref:NAD-dependent epimerase/dehydratase family protein n=1 Tax=Acididesulfobacter guangdongensis TaxID=2597225 RepID=A0A519BHY2_ACIG2|nr:MAG: NAD-dependent epimerase/dehydratase family protein [Candidatus Acididesulfobacter guangdongensis]
MNILLTGASGFVGHYIIQELSRFHTCVPLIDERGTVDLRDIGRIKSFLNSSQNCRYDAVIHLAAQSFVPESFKNPLETYNINFIGTYNLFSVLKEYGFCGKILYISSSDIYGYVSENKLPITEDYPLKPRNPYAVSKAAAEALCYQWSATEDVEIVIARPFNHIGPNQSERFAVSSFAKQIAEISLGLKKPAIIIGNIDTTRDFLDVRDVAAAYKLLLEKGINSDIYDIYNVCSGKEVAMRSIIDTLCNIAGVEVEIEIDENKLRPNEQKRVCGSNEKIKKIIGWEQKKPLEKSLADILGYWKERLKK